MTTADPTIKSRITPREDIPEPVLYNVVYINDEVTTREFVIETLVIIFDYTQIDAEALTQKIHDTGSGIAATLPFEMAEQKGVEVTSLARTNGFPLVIKLEPVA